MMDELRKTSLAQSPKVFGAGQVDDDIAAVYLKSFPILQSFNVSFMILTMINLFCRIQKNNHWFNFWVTLFIK